MNQPKLGCPGRRHLWLDSGYNGWGKGSDWVQTTVGWTVDVLRAIHRFKYYWVPKDIPPDQIDWSQYLPEPGFHVLPRRWVVERTFAWLLFNRRLSRDHERLCATSETWIYPAMIRLMVRRLVRLHSLPTDSHSAPDAPSGILPGTLLRAAVEVARSGVSREGCTTWESDVGPFTLLIIILAILLLIPATILLGYRRPHGSVALSSGATLVLLAIFCLLGGPGALYNPTDAVPGAVIMPFLAYGGVLLLLTSWTLSLNAAAQARHWLWVVLLLCAGLLTFSLILGPFVLPVEPQCLSAQNASTPYGPSCPSINPLVPILIVVGYFVSPAAALVYAVRPPLLAWRRTHQLPEGLTVSRLGATKNSTIEPDLPA